MNPVLFLKFPYSSTFGGGEHHTLTVCSALQERGTPFFFVGSCGVLLKEFRKRGWRAHRWWAGKEPVAKWSILVFPFTILFAWLGLAAVFLWYRYRHHVRTVYCLSLTEKIVLTPFARLLGARVLWVEHLTFERWLSKNPYRYFYVWWSRCATVIGISNVIQQQARSLGVPASCLHVAYNGITLPLADRAQRTSDHWGQRFIVGSIARLEQEKGVQYLLRAFQQFLSFVPHARLVLVGEGSQRRQLEWLSRQLAIYQSVQWVGFQNNTGEWIRSFDCFVLPSVTRESFGIVVLEAQAYACPVVASELGGLPELVHQNQTGLLVEPGNSDHLLQALLYLYRHPERALEMGQEGRRQAGDRFTVEHMVTTMLSFFA